MASEPWQRTCGRPWEVSLANDSSHLSASSIASIVVPVECATLSRYRRNAYRTHGLPWAFKRLPPFWFKAPWGSDRLGDELNLSPRRRQSDPDQFPDDVVDRVEPREPVLGTPGRAQRAKPETIAQPR